MKKLSFSFINKKGILKNVFVMVDDQTAVMVSMLSETERVDYLTDLYHEDMRERNYQKHIIHSDNYFGEDEDLELADESVDEEAVEAKLKVEEILSKLEPADRKLIEDYYLKGMTQQAIATSMNVSQKMISKRIKNTLEKLRKSL